MNDRLRATIVMVSVRLISRRRLVEPWIARSLQKDRRASKSCNDDYVALPYSCNKLCIKAQENIEIIRFEP